MRKKEIYSALKSLPADEKEVLKAGLRNMLLMRGIIPQQEPRPVATKAIHEVVNGIGVVTFQPDSAAKAPDAIIMTLKRKHWRIRLADLHMV